MRIASLLVAVSLVGCADDGGTNTARTCSMPEATADAGALSAMFAQRCNVPMSMGERKWYRMAATLPGSTDVLQVELYDNAGPFEGGAVRTGTFPVDPDPTTCGVCVRALGDKGGADEMEYFATGGTVTISALGPDGTAFSAEVADLALEQVADHTLVENGCTASIAGAQIDGTIVDHTGSGGGTGGGGGMGGNACATTVGDAEKQ